MWVANGGGRKRNRAREMCVEREKDGVTELRTQKFIQHKTQRLSTNAS